MTDILQVFLKFRPPRGPNYNEDEDLLRSNTADKLNHLLSEDVHHVAGM